MKQALTEALAFADAPGFSLTHPDFWIHGPSYIAAARLVERLLPGECEYCGGSGLWGVSTSLDPNCQGSGQVWDEGIVEAVAKYLGEFAHFSEDRARGVLSALVELLTEKAGVADRPVLDSIEGVDPSEYSIELSTQPSRLPE